MKLTDPIEALERFDAERAQCSDASILDELRELEPIPDEQDDAAWDVDATWLRAYMLIALARHVAKRRLEAGVGLILEGIAL